MAQFFHFDLLVLFLMVYLQISMAMEDALVEIENGVKLGGSRMTTLNERPFLAFRAIPYAEPPVGELRFKAPVAKQWTSNELFDASKKGADCLQSDLSANRFSKSTGGQEDCLVLNVFTHSTSKPLRKVMVFIHGGGFIMGSSNQYGPKRLLDRDLVLVTMNYRVGPFGFLSTMSKECPGNFGLLDQTEALKWVQRNIAAFGGNPNQVTLFGESAGSASVLNHLISPVSKDLFHMAIAQSGNLLCNWSERKNPMHWTNLLASKVMCFNSNTTAMINCMRKVSADKIIAAANSLNKMRTLTIFGPVVDGNFHSDFPSKLLKSNQIANKVPLMMGVTSREGLIFIPGFFENFTHFSDDLIRNIAQTIFGNEPYNITDDVIETIKMTYFNFDDVTDKRKIMEAVVDVLSDAMFVAPHYESLKYFLDAGINLFLYSFDYKTDHSAVKSLENNFNRGPAHTDDLFFLFDSQSLFPQDFNTPNDQIENKFLDIWTSFAQNGNPLMETQNEDYINWTNSSPDEILVYHLDQVINVNKYQPTHDWRLNFWFRKIPALFNASGKINPKQEL